MLEREHNQRLSQIVQQNLEMEKRKIMNMKLMLREESRRDFIEGLKRKELQKEIDTSEDSIEEELQADIFKNPNYAKIPLGYWRNVSLENPINHKINKFADFTREDCLTERPEFKGVSPYVKKKEVSLQEIEKKRILKEALEEQIQSKAETPFWVTN